MPRYTTNVYMPAPRVQIKLEGDWEKVTAGIDGLPKAIRQGYDSAVDSFSKKLIALIRDAIYSGGPEGTYWAPLSPETIKTYAKKGLTDTSPWLRTGILSRSLGVYNYGDRVYIGLPSNAPYPDSLRGEDSGLTFIQLVRLLETGSTKRNIPGRPLFKPSLETAGGRRKLKANIIQEIRRKLIPLGFKPNQVKW